MMTKAHSIAILVLLLALVPVAASAQETTGEVVGPYIVAIDISPDPPTARGVLVAVTVSDAVTGEPVDNADVRVLTVNEEDGTVGDTPTRNSSTFSGYYRTPLTPDPGTWSLQIAIASDLGEVAIDQPPLVIPALNPPIAGTLTYALIMAAIVGVSTYLWWSSRKARQRRAAASTATQ
jgi:hypothetical protein